MNGLEKLQKVFEESAQDITKLLDDMSNKERKKKVNAKRYVYNVAQEEELITKIISIAPDAVDADFDVLCEKTFSHDYTNFSDSLTTVPVNATFANVNNGGGSQISFRPDRQWSGPANRKRGTKYPHDVLHLLNLVNSVLKVYPEKCRLLWIDIVNNHYFAILTKEFLIQYHASSILVDIFSNASSNLFELYALYKEYCKEKEGNEDIEHKINFIEQYGNNLELMEVDIKPKHAFDVENYNEDFAEIMPEIIKFVEDEEHGLCILNGDPGTGKTSFIKHLCTLSQIEVVYVDKSMISALSSPNFTRFALDNLSNKILIIEDAESLVQDRGADRDYTTTNLLNLSDGIIADAIKAKVILTFNCPITAVDPALVRAGRLKIKYEFKKLTKEKVKFLSEKNNIPAKDEEMTLADLFNTVIQKEENNKKKIGFGKG